MEDYEGLSACSDAIGDNRYLDPPDGGSVSLAEQVRRMRTDRDAAQRELAACRLAIAGLLEAMEMQERRETGAFHISQPSAWFIWDAAKKTARELLAANA